MKLKNHQITFVHIRVLHHLITKAKQKTNQSSVTVSAVIARTFVVKNIVRYYVMIVLKNI